MQILTVPLDFLVPDPQNPRAHPAENISAIKESLKRFGQRMPVLVREADCRIVAGNGTVEAMRTLGWTECEVALYDGDDAECRALSVALNRTAELAVWHEDNLAAAVGELQAGGFDAMDALGFDTSALDGLVHMFKQTAPDFPPVPQDEQPRLDQRGDGMELSATCPACGCEFKPAA